MLRRILHRSITGVALLLVSGCGGSAGGGGGPATGEFTVTVTTSSALTFTGTGSSYSRPSEGFTAFFIGDDMDSGLTLTIEGPGRPDPGTYPIADFIATDGSAPGQALVRVNAPGNGHDLTSASGTLTITVSTSSEVSGRFTFQGTAGVGGVTGTVEGVFTTTHSDA